MIIFEHLLEDHLFSLHKSLEDKIYRHDNYEAFYVHDPKMRHIHKACVKDRVIHHLVSKKLEEIFDPTFYAHSYSCRKDKGTHKAVRAFIAFARKASKNNVSKLFVLKCDIRKFFASVDHNVLFRILSQKIHDADFLWLLNEIIESFQSNSSICKGMPIGNLTSQVFANIYMNPLDQYIKHQLKEKYYIRYADDFVIFSGNKKHLKEILFKIDFFLLDELKLFLHPNKINIRDYYQGIDFLGYIIFPHFVIPRTKTKQRMLRKLSERSKFVDEGKISLDILRQTLQSYLGYLSHCNSFKLSQEVKKQLKKYFLFDRFCLFH